MVARPVSYSIIRRNPTVPSGDSFPTVEKKLKGCLVNSQHARGRTRQDDQLAERQALRVTPTGPLKPPLCISKPTISTKMSVNATSSEKPTYEFKVAKTKDEIEACYDIRLEGELYL